MHAGPSATPASRVTKIHLISPFGAENKKNIISYFMVERHLKNLKRSVAHEKEVESFCGARLAKTTQEVNLVDLVQSVVLNLEPSFSHTYMTT